MFETVPHRAATGDARGQAAAGFALLLALLAGCGAEDDETSDGPEKIVAKPPQTMVREPDVHPGDRIYAVAAGREGLFRVNPKTGAVRSVGSFGLPIGGMEDVVDDPRTSGVSAIGVHWVGYPSLVRIDLKTGEATDGPRIIGRTIRDKTTVEAIAFVGDILYGSASGPDSFCVDCADRLYRIDPKSGEATEVGRFGRSFLNVEAMAYHEKYGLLGADIGTIPPDGVSGFNTHPTLIRIEPLTGRASKIADLPPSTLETEVHPRTGRTGLRGPFVSGLSFDPDGTLYAATIPTHFGGLSELWRIDPIHASVTSVGIMNANDVMGITYVRPAKTEGEKDATAEKPAP